VKLLFSVFLAGLCAPLDAHEVKPLTKDQCEEYKLDPGFYRKGTLAQDILIATSEKVSDAAHLEAAYQFEMIMKSIDREVAQRVRERKVLCLLVAHNEFTSDMPQFRTDKKGKELDFYNWRSRGFLTWKGGRPTVFFAEEDVLEFEGGMQIESILIHEFGHVVHGAGFSREQKERLATVYKAAMKKGIWHDGRAAQRFRRVRGTIPVSLLESLRKWFPAESPELLAKCLDGGDVQVNGKPASAEVKVTGEDKVLIVFGGEKRCYAASNLSEYWAEGFQSWYDTNRTMDHDHNHIHEREQLRKYDPGLAGLCEEVMGSPEWRFVSPRERAGSGHLKGYDPEKAPVVVDPGHIENAAYDYYDKYWHAYWQRLYDKHGLKRPVREGKKE
jgi:hypothetical protein|tara:strand:- start:2341 stop:3498 length:1158 start_codon:yes stop_codon:yes gene_type:complete